MKHASLLLLLLLPLVAAENVTISVPVAVNLTCGSEQCIITGPGVTSFFANTNSSQSYTLSVPVSYENVTVQNITLIQNSTNITVVTQVVNVTQCDAVSVSTEQLSSALTNSIVSVCQTACEPGQAQKDQCNTDVRTAQAGEQSCRSDLAGLQARFDAQDNISTTQYNALNETCVIKIQEQRQANMPLLILAVIAVLVAAGVIGIVFTRSRGGKNNSGPGIESALPSLEDG